MPVKQFLVIDCHDLGFCLVAVLGSGCNSVFKPHIAWIIVGVMSVGYAVFLYFDAFSKKDYRSPVMYTLLSFLYL